MATLKATSDERRTQSADQSASGEDRKSSTVHKSTASSPSRLWLTLALLSIIAVVAVVLGDRQTNPPPEDGVPPTSLLVRQADTNVLSALDGATVSGNVQLLFRPRGNEVLRSLEIRPENAEETSLPDEVSQTLANGDELATDRLSNGGYTLVAQILEDASETTLEVHFRVANRDASSERSAAVQQDDMPKDSRPPDTEAGNLDTVLSVDFEGIAPDTPMNESVMRQAFLGQEFAYLKAEKPSADVVEEDGSNVMRVNYEDGEGFPGQAAEIELPATSYASLEYRFKFDKNFNRNFGKKTVGGKLPGLGAVGTTSAYDDSEIKPPMHCVNNLRQTDGWSARHMWNREKGMHQYLYYTGKANNCGDVNDFKVGRDEGGWLESDRWYRLKQIIDIEEGSVRTFLDGKPVATTRGIQFHEQPINRLIWNIYINNPGPDNNTHIYFDDVYVKTRG